MLKAIVRALALLLVVVVASAILANDAARAQPGTADDPGTIYVPGAEGSDGDGATVEPSTPGITVTQPKDGAPWNTLLFALVFLTREISAMLERRQRQQYADATAERAVRVVLARLDRGDVTADPGPGAIVDPS